MAELKLISPLLSNMEVLTCISVRGAVSVYIVRSNKSGQTYVLKHISVPESQKQVDALLFTGAASSNEEAQKYYEQVVSDYQNELQLLETLSASPNLDCFRSYQIVPKEDAVGYDVYLLAEHRKSLVQYLADNAMTHLCAVNLAMDLCSALMDLRAAGLVHRDVKPSNIYLSNQGHFILGDLGIAKIEELKYCSMPESMLSSYSAPELFSLVGTIDPTTDIYSVGMILYRIFNGNHGPFEDEKTSAKAADRMRVTGEELPAPMYADYEMAEIIRKACAYTPADRYQTPDELKDALVEYMKRNQLEDTLIVPPIAGEPEPIDPNLEEEVEPVQFADAQEISDDFKESFSPDTQMLNSIIDSVHKDISGKDSYAIANSLEPEEDDDAPVIELDARPRKRKRRNKWLPVVVSLLILAAAIASLVYFLVVAPSTIHVDEITLVDRGTEYLTVHVKSNEKDGAFGVICSDAYGNTSRLSYVAGTDNTFTNLVPGTQYTISIESANNEKLSGSYTLKASTVAQTEILSFTATPISLTQAELNLIILEGPDPGMWNVTYSADGVSPQTMTFSGHSAVIANLESGKQYTFKLQEPEGTKLTGATSVDLSTVPTVSISKIKLAVSSSSAILSWTIEGDAPESWTVTITGDDGYSDTQIVTAPTITFENLTSGEQYHVEITAPTMLDIVATTIQPAVTKLTSFDAQLQVPEDPEQPPTEVVLSWACETDPAESGWKITGHVHGIESEEPYLEILQDSQEENKCVVLLSSLLPNTTYDFTLTLESGELLEGKNTVSITTPQTESYDDHGLSDVYVGMYLKPDREEWSYLHLSTARTEFTTDEAIAFAMQSIKDVTESDESITVTLLLRDENGNLIDYDSFSKVWDEMWEKNMFAAGFPRTPQKAGTYSLEVYFNNLYVTSKTFEIEAVES